jgi:hypothetical protein
MVADCERDNSKFVLLLRSFENEASELRVDTRRLPTDSRRHIEWELEITAPYRSKESQEDHQTRITSISYDEENAESRMAEALAHRIRVVGIRHPSGRPAGRGLENGPPKLYLDQEKWQDGINQLITLAPLIVVLASSLTSGLRFELQTILERRKERNTLIVFVARSEFASRIDPLAVSTGIKIPKVPRLSRQNRIIRRFPHIVDEGEIDYERLDDSAVFRRWIGQASIAP